MITKKDLFELLKDKPDDFPIYVSAEQWHPKRQIVEDSWQEEGYGDCTPQEVKMVYKESHRLTLLGKVQKIN